MIAVGIQKQITKHVNCRVYGYENKIIFFLTKVIISKGTSVSDLECCNWIKIINYNYLLDMFMIVHDFDVDTTPSFHH